MEVNEQYVFRGLVDIGNGHMCALVGRLSLPALTNVGLKTEVFPGAGFAICSVDTSISHGTMLRGYSSGEVTSHFL